MTELCQLLLRTADWVLVPISFLVLAPSDHIMAEALGVAGSAVGVISLGIQVCQGLLAYYDSWKGCHQDIADTLRSVASLDKTLKYLREIVEDQIKPGESIEQQIGDIVAQCAAGIQALEGELGKFKKYTESADIRAKFNSHLRRLQYPFKEDTLAKLRQSVQDVRDSLVPALGILQIKKLSSIEEQTRNMTISLASSENCKFHLSLCSKELSTTGRCCRLQ